MWAICLKGLTSYNVMNVWKEVSYSTPEKDRSKVPASYKCIFHNFLQSDIDVYVLFPIEFWENINTCWHFSPNEPDRLLKFLRVGLHVHILILTFFGLVKSLTSIRAVIFRTTDHFCVPGALEGHLSALRDAGHPNHPQLRPW